MTKFSIARLFPGRDLTRRLLRHRHALSIWLALVFNMFVVFLHRLYIAGMIPQLAGKFQTDLVGVSGLVTATFYGYALCQIPGGILVDRIGIRSLNLFTSCLTLLATILFVATDLYWVAWLARFLIGMGTSAVIVSIFKVQSLWFREVYFSRLSSFMAIVSNLGMMAGTRPLNAAVAYIGYNGVLYGIIGLSFASWLLVLYFVKDKNQLPGKEPSASVWDSLKEVLTCPYTWPPVLIIFFFLSTMSAMMGLWGTSFLTEVYHMSSLEASSYTLFFTLGFVVGAPFVPVLETLLKGNYRRGLTLSIGLYALCWFYIVIICQAAPDVRILPSLFFLMGACSMAHLLAFTAVKDGNRIENAGLATSVVNSTEFAGSAVLNQVIALTLAKAGNYQAAFMIMLVFAVAAVIVTFFVKVRPLQKLPLD